MKIVNINDKKAEKTFEALEARKESCLEILDEMRSLVESGEIIEFVACSADINGSTQIHCAIKDYLGGIGMMEMGKYTLTQITIEQDYED